MSVQFTPENLKRFEEVVKKYEVRRSALLPTLYIAQEQFDYLSNEVLMYVAKLIDIPPGLVFEAASFYTMFKKKDWGKNCFQVCNNITCTMMGSEELIATIHQTLGIGLNEKTADNQFSMQPVQCLGSCNTAPVVQLNNEDYHENMTPDKMKSLIEKLRREA